MAIDRRHARCKLPATMVDRSSFSIFSVIRQAIGQDLTRFSFPVIWNEPLSFLQRLAECLEYSSLLDRAVLATSPVERLHLITAFVVSHLSAHLERLSKPFNPLLGETYELKVKDESEFHYVAEQVSHHPPISALCVRGKQWTLHGYVEPAVKIQGTNVVATSDDRWTLRIHKTVTLSRSSSQSSFESCTEELDQATCDSNDVDADEIYTWKTPTVVIHNILFGQLWCEFQGQINIKHCQSNYHSLLTIKSIPWLASQSVKSAAIFKYDGFISDGEEKLAAFHGDYGHCYYAVDTIGDLQTLTSTKCSIGGNSCIRPNSNSASPCNLCLTPSSRLIWHRAFPLMDEKIDLERDQYYHFTPFTMCLNEENYPEILPPTDSRYRQDVRHLENGDVSGAAAEKHRLEEQQRAEARARSEEFQPLWFKKLDTGDYIYTGNYDKRQFDLCPNLFSQKSHTQ